MELLNSNPEILAMIPLLIAQITLLSLVHPTQKQGLTILSRVNIVFAALITPLMIYIGVIL